MNLRVIRTQIQTKACRLFMSAGFFNHFPELEIDLQKLSPKQHKGAFFAF